MMKSEMGKKVQKIIKPAAPAVRAAPVAPAVANGNQIISKMGLLAGGTPPVASALARGKVLPGLPAVGSGKAIPLLEKTDANVGGHISIKSIFGTDDRVQISASDDPYRRICFLDFFTANGAHMRGTGWLVGPSTVITAGHCVWDRENGNQFNQSMQIFPARNGHSSPASANAVDFQTVTAWAQDGNTAYDYGAVFLDRPLGNDFGFFAFSECTDDELQQMTINVVGYPATIQQNGQTVNVDPPLLFGQSSRIEAVLAHELRYTIDTTAGQSGCPVICWDGDDKYSVVGIHNEGASDGNYATRITSDVFDNIKTWKNH